MLQFFAKYKKFAIVMAILSAVILYTFYTLMQPAPSLPIYQPTMVDNTLVDSTVQFVKNTIK